MSDLPIHREVSDDARTVQIEFLSGPSMTLTRDQAIALLETLYEVLPQMAVKI